MSATSDQPWLAITAVLPGSVAFSFQANQSAASRVAHITIFGQQVTVTQSGDTGATISKTAGDGQAAQIGQPFGANCRWPFSTPRAIRCREPR